MDIRSHPAIAPIINSQRNILLIGMSGIGKSWLSQQLMRLGCWHYISIDMDIQNHFLKEELRRNCGTGFDGAKAFSKPHKPHDPNPDSHEDCRSLARLTTYLGMPGSTGKGGLSFNEYFRRQEMHRKAEIRAVEALLETKVKQPIIADMSGSFCEIVSPDSRLMADLKKQFKIISLRENDAMVSCLIKRFNRDPKPIYFPPDFLLKHWEEYTSFGQISEQDIDPKTFMFWIYKILLEKRRAKYAVLSNHCNIRINASDLQ